jgi:hypothetical protein
MSSDEHIRLLRDCLHDNDGTKQLLDFFGCEDMSSRHMLIDKFCGEQKFAIAFDEWIRNQSRPFLGFKPVDEPTTTSSLTTTNKPVDIMPVNDSPKLDISTLPIARTKKTKKRVAPVTIASSLPSSLNDASANTALGKSVKSSGVVTSAASAPDQWPALGPTAASKMTKEEWPNLGDTVSKPVRRKVTPIVVPDSSLQVQPANPAFTSGATSTTPSAAFPPHAASNPSSAPVPNSVFSASSVALVPPLPIAATSNSQAYTSPQKINRGESDVSLSVPSMYRQISTSVKAQLDSVGVTVRVMESPYCSSPLSGGNVLGLGQFPTSSVSSPSMFERTAVVNMARVYSKLVVEQLLPLVPSFIFLSRLLTTRHTYRSLGKEILVEPESDQKFPSYLLCDADLEAFLGTAARSLVDAAAALGPDVCSTYADLVEGVDAETARAIRLTCKNTTPSAADKAIEEDAGLGDGDGTTGSVVRQASEASSTEGHDVETFIRPFHDELDSRNEYRSQVSLLMLAAIWFNCLFIARGRWKQLFTTSGSGAMTTSAIYSDSLTKLTEATWMAPRPKRFGPS